MTYPARKSSGESFERFYLRNVAISEGCGCAELVIRRESAKPTVRDAGPDAPGRGLGWRRVFSLPRQILTRIQGGPSA